jgi:hypothetical protein
MPEDIPMTSILPTLGPALWAMVYARARALYAAGCKYPLAAIDGADGADGADGDRVGLCTALILWR